jgi:hypothetical protein
MVSQGLQLRSVLDLQSPRVPSAHAATPTSRINCVVCNQMSFFLQAVKTKCILSNDQLLCRHFIGADNVPYSSEASAPRAPAQVRTALTGTAQRGLLAQPEALALLRALMLGTEAAQPQCPSSPRTHGNEVLVRPVAVAEMVSARGGWGLHGES